MRGKTKDILRKVFGYPDFLPLQEDIIKSLLEKTDTLVVMPTGGGKSLCYQVPALIFEGITVIISPLISLMQDQVRQLVELGVPAVLLNSQLVTQEYRRNIDRLKDNSAKLVYVAPETFLKTNFLALLSSLQVDCVAVDEAHCISKWGHDFRPEYRRLANSRPSLENATWIALTSTATSQVQKDIKESLELDSPNQFIGGFDRKNLFIEVIEKANPYKQVLSFVEKFPNESGIIYCSTRKTTDDLCKELQSMGVSARPYHGGLGDHERNKNQELFVKDDVNIVVATIAFGMGINKPDVRFVLHYDMTRNIESYYQEIGRAGRDGLRADCLMLFDYKEVNRARSFIRNKDGHEQKLANIHLNSMLYFLHTEFCRRIPLLDYFGDEHPGNCGMCDNCALGDNHLVDITTPAQMFLSCVKRTDENFGASYVIDVLRGSKSTKIYRNKHEKISTYDIGREYSKKQWQHMARQFVGKRLVRQNMDYGGLSLTENGLKVLKGEQRVLVRKIPSDVSPPHQGPGSKLQCNSDLFELLRAKRKALAEDESLPPYVIFYDKTLIEVATVYPQNREDFLKIHGVGAAKWDKYGDIFLSVVKEFCKANPPGKVVTEESEKPATMNQGQAKYVVIGNWFNNGKSISEIAKSCNVQFQTVLDNLYKFVSAGHRLNYEELLRYSNVSVRTRGIIFNCFKRHGCKLLKPIYEKLSCDVDYNELKICRLYYIGSGRTSGNQNTIKIVCLANSEKYQGRCIAGKDYTDNQIGQWIRPVSARRTAELKMEEIILKDGSKPETFDVLQMVVGKKQEHDYQVENYLVENRKWTKAGRFPLSETEKLCDDIDSLWINGYSSYNGKNDRIPLELVRGSVNSSLVFIEAEDPSIIVEVDKKGLNRVRSEFVFKEQAYLITVTDPLIKESFMKKKAGKYSLAADRVFVTVSLGEPFEGYCYKLAAGIFTT